MKTRYEWVMGPSVVVVEAKEFHAGKAKLESGKRERVIVGQLRDYEIGGKVVTWASKAPVNRLLARVYATELAAKFPRALDWMPKTPTAEDVKPPSGWTFPECGAPFERGFVI